MPKQLTTEQFIKKSKSVHGENTFGYSKTEYFNCQTPVTLICPEHGEFIQNVSSHLMGRTGCVPCAKRKHKNKRTYTTEQFIQDAIAIHGTDYDYSKVVYKHSFNKVTIICKKHGEFMQCRNDHINAKHGCPECGKNYVSENLFRDVLENLFFEKLGIPYKFPSIRPDWLRNPETNRKLELDCYNEDLQIAFELQGAQHYQTVKGWGGEEKYAKRVRRDIRKKHGCREQGVYLIAIDNRPVTKKCKFSKQEYYRNQIIKELKALPESFKKRLIEAKNNNK